MSADGLRWGVEPICAVLTEHGVKIAPSTYYAARHRPASLIAQRHASLLPEVVRVQTSPEIGRGLYGARKVWKQLLREEVNIGRGQVESLMRSAGLKGIRRGKQFVTTRPDKAASRPPDLVDRDFTANRPNELWVVDIKCRRRHLMSYADLRTMPTSALRAQFMRGSKVRKVGIVA